jgi:hypothetical protein
MKIYQDSPGFEFYIFDNTSNGELFILHICKTYIYRWCGTGQCLSKTPASPLTFLVVIGHSVEYILERCSHMKEGDVLEWDAIKRI